MTDVSDSFNESSGGGWWSDFSSVLGDLATSATKVVGAVRGTTAAPNTDATSTSTSSKLSTWMIPAAIVAGVLLLVYLLKK